MLLGLLQAQRPIPQQLLQLLLLLAQFQALEDLIVDTFAPIQVQLSQDEWVAVLVEDVDHVVAHLRPALEADHLQLRWPHDQLLEVSLQWSVVLVDSDFLQQVWAQQALTDLLADGLVGEVVLCLHEREDVHHDVLR